MLRPQIFPPAAGDPLWGCDPYPDGNVVGPVVAPAIYWTDRYKILRSPKQGLFAPSESALLDPSHNQAGCRSYWHVECFGIEKLMATELAEQLFETTQSTTTQLQGLHGAHPSSSLKVLLEWSSARQEKRILIADIGTGFDIKIGPALNVKGFLLVPDPPEDIVIPSALQQLEGLSTATLVTARGTPMNSQGTTWNGRYTQTLLTSEGEATLHEVPRFARWVQVYVANANLNNPPDCPPTSTVDVSFIYDQIPGDTDLAPVGCAGTFGGGNIEAARLPIPQNASSLALSSGSPQLVTLVYGLAL